MSTGLPRCKLELASFVALFFSADLLLVSHAFFIPLSPPSEDWLAVVV